MNELDPRGRGLTRRSALALAAAALAAPPSALADDPGLLITGGPIYTGVGEGQRVEAVATRGDRIVFAGSLAEARAAAPGARAIDLAGAAAYAVGREAELGTLEAGKRADISVFSRDLMTVEPAEILKARPMLTVVAGQTVYAA